MNYELDPRLRKEAEWFLHSNSAFKGPRYFRGPIKQALDILISGPAMSIVLPVVFLLGMAILASDRHWPFVDVGCQDPANPNKHIPFWKLRTMIPNAQALEFELANSGWSVKDLKKSGKDPRITPIGRLLRRTSLDEFPQFLNSLRGNISVVGSRMPTISQWANEIYPQADNEPYKSFLELLRQGLQFGITGMYFVMGRTNLSLIDKTTLEVLYGQNANFISDLRIIAWTIPTLLSSKGI